MNFKAVLALPKMARSAQTHKSIGKFHLNCLEHSICISMALANKEQNLVSKTNIQPTLLKKKRKTFDVLTSKRLLGKPLFVYHFLDDRRDYSKGQ